LDWNDKRVLVTGAGGFIGSHLTERLAKSGAKVRALVHYNALNSWGWLEHSSVKNDIEVVSGDVCDRDSVREAMRDVETVFHLAALIAIPYSYHAPASYINTNIMGTLNILQAGRELNVERIVQTSTSEVYGTARYVPIDEAHTLQGQSPYSASKIGADKLAESFYCSFGLPVVTVRPFNTFGPRQSTRAIIPTIITQCISGKTVHLGNLHPTRDLNYITNTVDGFLLAASKDAAIGKTINLGSGREISILELANLISSLIGEPIQIESEDRRQRPEGSEVERLLADRRLAHEILGWSPTVSLEDGLMLTIEWIKQNIMRYKTDDYVL
jgi:NAD dependent epimerase/dehydratase